MYRYNISQNDVSDNSDRPLVWHSIMESKSESLIYYNNVFYLDRADMIISKGYNTKWDIIDIDTQFDAFYNNIFISRNNVNFGKKAVFSHNAYYGLDGPVNSSPLRDAFKITTNPIFNSQGAGSIQLKSVNDFKLLNGSPCIKKGIQINNNGGRDFFGNIL